MVVLGISGVFGHDAAACLMRDGEVLAMVEEERLTRRKHAFGALPVEATLCCATQAGVALGDIDCVATSWDPALDPGAARLQQFTEEFLDHDLWRPIGHRPRVEHVSHHLAHAASAYYGSGFPESAVLVIDGNGENGATSLGFGRGRQLEMDQTIGVSHSLGHFYKYVTYHVGLGGNGEGKMMGLAAYGRPTFDFDVIRTDESGYRVDLVDVDALPIATRFDALFRGWCTYLEEHFGPRTIAKAHWDVGRGCLNHDGELRTLNADLAASAQAKLTRVILHLVGLVTARYRTRRLVLAGGVALNCSVNGDIMRSGLIDELYVAPASHDAGGAVGAAQVVSSRHGGVAPLRDAYLGPEFSNEAVFDTLGRSGLHFEEPPDVVERTAQLLEEGLVIGWFQGRMEIGPRALGHRSILALADKVDVRDRVNRVKGRERWRPLSPSLCATAAPEYLADVDSSPYMLVASRVTDRAHQVMPAVIHHDETVRAQTVSATTDPYSRLLRTIERRTGAPVVLNTSFNLAGEPMVCTPTDAVRSFCSSELDALVMGGFVVRKPTRAWAS